MSETLQADYDKELVKKFPTLKFLTNKTHLGPADKFSKNARIGGAATGHLVTMNNLKVTWKDSEENNPPKPYKQSQIFENVFDATEAAYYFAAWDELYTDIGTEAYIEKWLAFKHHKDEVYKDLGVWYKEVKNPKTKSMDEVDPELNTQQQQYYNKRMKAYAFYFWEYKLSWKCPEVRASRTATYRSLKPMDIDTVLKNLEQKVTKLKGEVTISRKS